MSTSRRHFLLQIAATGVLAKLPTSVVHALAGPVQLYPPRDLSYFAVPLHHGDAEIRLGYAAIAWDGKDNDAIEQISAVGYTGIQLRANVVKEFPDPHALRDLLQKHGLAFVALSSGTAPLNPEARQNTIDDHVRNAQYLNAAGGKYLQVIGASSKDHASPTAEDYKYEGRLLTEIGKRVADLGIDTGFHNHMGTIGQTPEAVDAILDAADPRYVKLELDTAHYQQGGGDPATAIRKYGKRLLFLHLKDTKPAATPAGYEFVELGQGRVNFPAIFAALNEIHFRGWGIVELDGKRAEPSPTPRESAEISKNYLEQKVGLHI
jgi:inosose dehydratase